MVSLLTFWSIYFFAQFSSKKCFENSFLAHFCNFWCTFWSYLAHTLLLTQNMESENEKKIQNNICWSSEMSVRDNFQKLVVEISKNLKNCIICLKFQCPKRGQIILKLINLALLNVEFYKFGWNSPNLCFWAVLFYLFIFFFIVAYFP